MNRERILHLCLLLIICGIVFGFRAGSQNFWGRHGEARRAEVSREMVVSGNWAVPHLNGEPFITKPPLYYWSAAMMFTLTGEFDELSARLPSIISGTLGVLVTYLWAGTIFSPRIGLLAGFILGTSFLYVGMARSAEVDMMLTLFTTSTLYFFTLGHCYGKTGQQKSSRSLFFFLLSTVCLALGTLTKYPIGVAVPLLAIVAFVIATRDSRVWRIAKPWWLLLAFLLLILPWFVMMYVQIPNFFDILYQETFGRYTNPGGTPHKESIYFYVPTLGAFAPWILFFPGIILSLWSHYRQAKLSRYHLFIVIAFVMTFLLFSSVGSKREYYLLPLYPFLAILTAKYWDEYLAARAHSTERWLWKSMAFPLVGFSGLLGMIGIGLPIASGFYLPQYLGISVMFGVMFLAGGILLFTAFSQGKVLRSFSICAGTTILSYIFALLTIVPEMNHYRSRKSFFRETAALVGEHLVVDYKYEGYDVQFYMQRIVPVVKEVHELETLALSKKPLFIIMTFDQYERFRQEHPELVVQWDIVQDQEWTSAINPKRTRRFVLIRHVGS
ncbi:hypothetical protein CSA56_10855 [candidate division KSB3 bacterium]|uniref:ArnT-like N-terminal domain-containing protein n=1 Tax=candidate division KSB3 bacterium TaxID=2044937 RepID=A0A2G6KD59_9BACT|nr:MAG: hypothetical protein CSA56_10855 [candidate division KSB3 bacterium]